MADPRWATYLQQHPNVSATGAKLTELLSPTEKQQFLDLEDQYHAYVTTTEHKNVNDLGEWTDWQSLDIGTRLALYYAAWQTQKNNDDWTHWEPLVAILPFELLPYIGGSMDLDISTFKQVKIYLQNLAAIYDQMAGRITTGVKPMTWQEYLAQHPELVTEGEAWTRAMAPAEKQQFLTWETQLSQWGQSFAGQPSTGWNEWVAGTTAGLRLLFYAGAYDAGLNNPKSVANIFPPSIKQPANATLAATWLDDMGKKDGGIYLFAYLRDKILSENKSNATVAAGPDEFKSLLAAPTSSGTDTTSGGSNTAQGSTSGGSSVSSIGILAALAFAAWYLTKGKE